MKAIKELSGHLKTRLGSLIKAKEQGRKIVGYTPGGFFPEELALACGAIPIGFIRGGDHTVVELANNYICRWVDTFCRAQIGYGVSGEDPYYKIVDLLVVPMTDNHIRAVMDVLDFHTDLEIFPFGIPHTKDNLARDYYLQGIKRLKKRLEVLTGVEITDARLREAIHLCNRERTLLKEISLMRKSLEVPIGSMDFVALNHGTFLAEKEFMVHILESAVQELKTTTDPVQKGPRILLTGSTLAIGDDKIMTLTEKAGGVIVLEDFAEGIRPYWENIAPEGDLMEALAECYFTRRVPPAWFRPSKERLDFLIESARDFQVAGMIWYQLIYRESYKTEAYYFPKRLNSEVGIPMLALESDYDLAEVGPMKIRIEAFIEMLRS